ncbi:protocadherin gamma-A11-like isoform X29 [Anguilla rostrata]|uniref:protocadherin gamma-A11-like isoform X29 n=1 Tax=Anguilla rostrata TaxID=7938 RepID=UPI0030D38E08
MSVRTKAWQVRLFLSVLSLGLVSGQVSYSISEEMAKGSVVGNIAQDLGLDLKRLKSGNARIYTGDSTEYIELNKDRGVLLIENRIDRESLCGKTSPCALHFQVILDSPMELYRVTVEILDINDNAPNFKKSEMRLEISESALPGARFVLERALDPDVGINDLQSYSLKPTDNFVLKVHNQPNGGKKVEIVLQKAMDREKQDELSLLLTAADGGEPQLSGTVQIRINVLDANDNTPVFTQTVYKSNIPESARAGTLLTTVSARDADAGSNGHVTYSVTSSIDGVSELFAIDEENGEVTLVGELDYEKSKHYQIDVEAKDHGGLSDSSKIIVKVIDVNDNSPVINVISKSRSIPENSPPDTVIAMIGVQDPDSENNGRVRCTLNEHIPFTIKSTSNDFFSLITEGVLDRETDSEFNVSVTCSDEGVPALSSRILLTVRISDVNDNAPVFQKNVYEAHIKENNSPGMSIFSVQAIDSDWNQNARVSYMLEEGAVNGASVSSYVSVNSDSGVVHALRSFDYEQIKDFQFRVKAQDGGSPPLSSNVTVKIFIQDQNDNAPQILYPIQTGVSLVAEMVPRSADVGYLVTKVVAVDVDSGQNAWLSYKLLKVTDRALFEVGLQNGEIRTVRPVTDKDAVKQRLTVVVEDNGQPSRSATVNVKVAVADSFPEVLSEFTDFTHDKDYNDNLTFYLVLALVVVSVLFVVSIIAIISVKIYRWRQTRLYYKSNGNLPVIPYYPPLYADIDGTGTLQHVYNYEPCRTPDSRKSDVKVLRPCSHNALNMDLSDVGTLRTEETEVPVIRAEKTPSDWHFSQNQRPGTSGGRPQGTQERWHPHGNSRAGPRPEDSGAVSGTSPWPNPPTEAEQLQALMAAANEVSDATATLGQRYNPQFTLQNVPDYRQNVYIPGSTATLTANQQQPPQPALPQPPPPADAPKPAQTPASKKKSTKKDKK